MKYEESISLSKESEKKQAIHRVALLVRELVGDRSIRRAAEDTGVAASYITGIMKERYLPSAEILRKLSLPIAKPQNGILLEDLMLAAGYQEKYSNNLDDYDVNGILVETQEATERGSSELQEYFKLLHKKGNDPQTITDASKSHKKRMQYISRYESLATGVILKELAQRNIAFSVEKETMGVRGFRPDLSVNVSEKDIRKWLFDFKYISSENRMIYLDARRILGQLIFVEPNPEVKVSIVINNKEAFDNLSGYTGKLSYRGELSVILIDEEAFSVVNEKYLAHYDLDSKEEEFYIVKKRER